MAGPVRSVEGLVGVERGVFGLMDVDGGACPRPWPEGSPPADELVWPQLNRVDLRSVGHDHYAFARLERWEGEPEPPPGEWDDDHEVCFASTSGEVELWTLTGGPWPHRFRIGPPETEYGLRVFCQGRQELLELTLSNAVYVPEGTERYLLQFWPLQPRRQAGEAAG